MPISGTRWSLSPTGSKTASLSSTGARHSGRKRHGSAIDENTEYRMVLREARNDRIESVLTKEEEEGMDPDLLFAEEALVKKEYIREGIHPKRLMIINRYRYTENDSLALKNYRISYCH